MNPNPDSSSDAPQTVIVVESDVLVRMPICQYLRDCGYHVLEASSTDEAIKILQEPHIQVNAVLSEIEVPGALNGFAFAQWARSTRPDLKIVLAGTPQRAAHGAGELCEHGPLLTKPYDHKLVLDRIKQLLAAREGQKKS